ncbi:MAG: response regulator transcription factor [Clostridiales bacterium]|nr:response regulator transcription factor [Clostridiales bacterium]
MARVLIVDDEENIRIGLREYAEFEGHIVTEAVDGMDAVNKCKNTDFDVIIMDIMMPRLDGFSACKEIRKIKDIPVLMLSARGEEYDKLFGFELGIDDYVVKPFSPKEVMARINVIVSRRQNAQKESENKHIIIKGIDIDASARKVYIDGKRVELTPKEYDLLTFMIKNKNIALSRNQLLSEVWGYEFFGDDRTVDTHIKMLRNSIEPYRDLISTVRGVGYIFETEE